MAEEYHLGDLLEHPYSGSVWSIYKVDFEDEKFYIRLVKLGADPKKTMYHLGSVQLCTFQTMDYLLAKNYGSSSGWVRYKSSFEIET